MDSHETVIAVLLVCFFFRNYFGNYLLSVVCVDAIEKRKSKRYIPAVYSPHGLAPPYDAWHLANNVLPVGTLKASAVM